MGATLDRGPGEVNSGMVGHGMDLFGHGMDLFGDELVSGADALVSRCDAVLTWRYAVLTWRYAMLTRCDAVLTCRYAVLTDAHGALSGAHGLVLGGHGLVVGGHEALTTRGVGGGGDGRGVGPTVGAGWASARRPVGRPPVALPSRTAVDVPSGCWPRDSAGTHFTVVPRQRDGGVWTSERDA